MFSFFMQGLELKCYQMLLLYNKKDLKQIPTFNIIGLGLLLYPLANPQSIKTLIFLVCLQIISNKRELYMQYSIFIHIQEQMFKKRVAKEQQILNLNQTQQKLNGSDGKKDLTQIKQSEQKLQRQQPQKKLKVDLPRNLISFSTAQNKDRKQAQIHKQFNSLNYSAVEQQRNQITQKDLVQKLQLEEQLAKKKYMQNVNATKEVKEGKMDMKVYRGMNNYANYALTEDQIVNAEQKFRKRQGPSRVNSTIRNTCRFDYNFGLCKDWHDSGYCPFGDSCIYLHDRSNYKTGWEQQRDFQRAEKERWRRINNPQVANKEDIQESLKSIEKYKVGQTCQKCNSQFKSPVEVQCGHIFCNPCAVTMNKCPTCKKALAGIMNNAQKKMQKMKETYEELKAKILKQHEQNKGKRKRYLNLQSQDVFAD